MPKSNGFTRHEILTTIKINGSMTADGLGKELGISPVAVRQHLASLEAEGMIEASVERRGLGRPVHRYAITTRGDETFPRSYDQLANSLLDEIRSIYGEQAIDALFKARIGRILAVNAVRMEGKTPGARLDEISHILAENGYMPVVSAGPDGDTLKLHNCAICQVALKHASACRYEQEMLQSLAGPDVVVRRLQHRLSNDHVCSYHFVSNGAATSNGE